MLNLNHDSEESSNGYQDQGTSSSLALPHVPILDEDGEPIWKVLVFDDLGRDVISSVLRVNDLRTWGVTMHMYVQRRVLGVEFQVPPAIL
jgi:sec1 family domain-containing protein 1